MHEAPHPLVWVGFLAFFAVALLVGVRLLRLAARTRKLPELCIGVGVLGIGPVGFGSHVASMELASSAPSLQSAVGAVGLLGVSLGVCCKLVFNWRVYHPARGWVGGLVLGAIALHAVLYVWVGVVPGFETYRTPGGIYDVHSAFLIGALLWGSAEALLYFARMRRRARIGLAEPVVASRFLLWGIGAGAAGLGALVGNVAQALLGVPSAEIPWVLASSSAHGLLAALAMWLAFLPPAAYTRWVERAAA